jgi:hypothetical protein
MPKREMDGKWEGIRHESEASAIEACREKEGKWPQEPGRFEKWKVAVEQAQYYVQG